VITIVPSPAKGQPFEMQASAIEVIGWVADPETYPIQPKPHTLEFLREVAHLRPRTTQPGPGDLRSGSAPTRKLAPGPAIS
jgi:asparaginyl-tRNA synthetase